MWDPRSARKNAKSLDRADGNLALTVDRNNRAIRYAYDRLDRVTQERWAQEGNGRPKKNLIAL